MKHVVVAMVLSIFWASESDAQLADVAKKERKRRESNGKDAVITLVGSGSSPAPVEETIAPLETTGDDLAEEPIEKSGTDVNDDDKPKSSMEEHWENAKKFEPKLAAIGAEADQMDQEYRDYLAACSGYTTTYESGSYGGTVRSTTTGVAYGRDWFGVWGSNSLSHVNGAYSGTSQVKNSDTPYCKALANRIVDRAQKIRYSLEAVNESARRAGVLPGHMRDLRRKYRLDWYAWN